MNRKAGSTELLEMDSNSFSKNINLDAFRSDPKSSIINKHDTVGVLNLRVLLLCFNEV